jgi:Cof subfamily protein (haloacid dehalogenase superfamily)
LSLRHPIRLVVIDLDGTLLDDSKRISQQTIKALLDLPQRGVKVIVASARPPRSVRAIYQQLALDTWQINYNGALIWDEPNSEVIFHRPLAGALARSIVEQARQLHPGILVTCEILDRWYTDRFEQTYTTATGRLFKPDVVAPLDTFCDRPITKLMLLGPPEVIGQLEPVVSGWHPKEIATVRTDPELIQIMHRRVGKSAALRQVARHYEIPLHEVMAIGDAPNDVGMLQLAGVSIAMNNAHPLVKRVADWIAPSNNDHGVCAALARYGLCSA